MTNPGPQIFGDLQAHQADTELAPWIRTDCPASNMPLVTMASCMVCSATGSAEACSNARSCGTA